METKGSNDLYEWELVNNAWVVKPKKDSLPSWRKPQTLAKLDTDGLKATADSRIEKQPNFYDTTKQNE